MKINQCKTQKEVNNYFIENRKKILEKHNISEINESVFDSYANERQKLLEKCGERLRKLKEVKNV